MLQDITPPVRSGAKSDSWIGSHPADFYMPPHSLRSDPHFPNPSERGVGTLRVLFRRLIESCLKDR